MEFLHSLSIYVVAGTRFDSPYLKVRLVETAPSA
jgi:uncharacterized protein YprB with RNaseH-like and TPR domain